MKSNDALFKKNTAYDVNENSEMLKGTQNYNLYTELRKKHSKNKKNSAKEMKWIDKNCHSIEI